jgi:hypothetical protein
MVSDYLDSRYAGFALSGGQCCCPYLVDTFYRKEENLAADEVNYKPIIGADYTRYKLAAPGDWIVGEETGRALCQVDGAKLTFYDEAIGAFLNATISFTLYDVSDTVILRCGPYEAKVSFVTSTKRRVEFVGGLFFEQTSVSPFSFPQVGTLGIVVYDKEYYEEQDPDVCNANPIDGVQLVSSFISATSDVCKMELGTFTMDDFKKYEIEATAAVTVESIGVYFAKPSCQVAPTTVACRNACAPDPLPSTVTVHVSGFTSHDGGTVCTDYESKNDCEDALDEACDDCLALNPGSPEVCFDDPPVTPSVQPCSQRVGIYPIENCWRPNVICNPACPCSSANGSFVLHLDEIVAGNICSCVYQAYFPAGADDRRPASNVTNSCYSDPNRAPTYGETCTEGGYDGITYWYFRLVFTVTFYDCTFDTLVGNLQLTASPMAFSFTPSKTISMSDFCGGSVSEEFADTSVTAARINCKRADSNDGSQLLDCSCYPPFSWTIPYDGADPLESACYTAGGSTPPMTIESGIES